MISGIVVARDVVWRVSCCVVVFFWQLWENLRSKFGILMLFQLKFLHIICIDDESPKKVLTRAFPQ